MFHDPEAADYVLGMVPGARVVGLDVTFHSVMSGAQLDSLRTAPGVFGPYVWKIAQFYKAFHLRTVGLDGIYLHDPTALLAAFRPELFTWTDGKARTDCAADPPVFRSGLAPLAHVRSGGFGVNPALGSAGARRAGGRGAREDAAGRLLAQLERRQRVDGAADGERCAGAARGGGAG